MNSIMLIADDSEMNREILRLLFQKSFEVLEAENGREALEILESCQGNIDIVLLDIMMPEMDGIEVLKKRRTLSYFSEVPVVVITANDNVESQISAFDLGASDFVTKPFIPEIVVSRVNNVMASRKRMATIISETETLKAQSQLDQMTGLYNKNSTESIVEDVLVNQSSYVHAMMIVDIDNFKSVNDMSGHLVGDHTIRIVADQVSSQFRQSDIVGRIGGDEFVVLMKNIPSKDIARRKANELVHFLKYKPNLTIPANVSISIGLAFSEKKTMSYRELFSMADQAIYEAKNSGKACMREYGAVPIEVSKENQRTVLVMSRNRNVTSALSAVLCPICTVCEVCDTQSLERVDERISTAIEAAYIDMSKCGNNSQHLWNIVNSAQWLCDVPKIIVCEEGNMHQYMDAISNGAADILSAPLEYSSLQRRVGRHIKRFFKENN